MRLWNCADLQGVESQVLDRYPKGRRPKRTKPLLSAAAAKITVRSAVVTLAVSISISTGIATRAEVFFPIPGVKVAQSLQKPTPSIAREFSDRFDGYWSQHHENDLLSLVESKRKAHESRESKSQADLNSIFSNQNENPEHDQGKLTLDEIKSLLGKRRRG